MKYRVKIEPSALDDLTSIVEWLAQHTEIDRLDWYDRLVAHIFTLETFPTRCPIAQRESAHWQRMIRCLHFGRKPHVRRILFEVEGSVVYILHITHGARQG